jgi:hypothetical protein
LSDGDVLVVGGTVENYLPTASVEIFDTTTKTWSVTDSMEMPRDWFDVVKLSDGRVMVAGGLVSDATSSVEIYDPQTGSWTFADSMNQARYSHALVMLQDGRILAVGGSTPTEILSSCEIYDPTLDLWSEVASLNVPRSDARAILLDDGRVLVIGGDQGPNAEDRLASCEIYDPASDQWTLTDSMEFPRTAHSAVKLNDGRVLVCGGLTSTDLTNTCEIYDPASGTWRRTADMNYPRVNFDLLLLPSGKVLAVGGNGLTRSVEIFDPVSESWSVGDSLLIARGFSKSFLLPNGDILVTGGMTGYLVPTPHCEIANYELNIKEKERGYHFSTRVAGNISKGRLILQITSETSMRISVDIYSASGRFVSRLFDGNIEAGSNTITITLYGFRREIPSGLYFLYIKPEGKEPQVSKIIFLH